MVIGLILIVLVIYLIQFKSLRNKNGTAFFISYLVYIWIYDWLFINLSYCGLNADLIIGLKLGNELLFICSFLLCLKQNEKKSVLAIMILILIYALVVSIINGNRLANIIQGVRLFLIPFLLPYFVSKIGVFENINMRMIVKALMLIVIITFSYAVYQSEIGTKLSNIWFYDYFKNNIDFEAAAFNYVRDDKLRVTSIFVSPIISSTFFSSSLLFIICAELSKKMKLIFIVICTYGLILSNTRIGFLFLGFALMFYMIRKKKLGWLVALIFGSIMLTFVSIMFIEMSLIDESAKGRFIQYGYALSNFTLLGQGLGDSDVLVRFDSFWISMYAGIGIVSLVFFCIIFRYVSELFKIRSTILKLSRKTIPLTTFSLLNLSFFIYASAFQFLAGSYWAKFTWLVMFAGIQMGKKSIIQQKRNVDNPII